MRNRRQPVKITEMIKTKRSTNYLLIIALALLTLIVSSCSTPTDSIEGRITEEKAQQLAEYFLRNSPTFTFDGIEDTLQLVDTLYPDIENAWQFVFRFESRYAGYGDRTGQMLAQVITPHEAIITVANGEITNAVMDAEWDMLNQQMIAGKS